MIPIDKKTICLILVLIVTVALCVYSYFLSGDRGGADRVREHIDTAAEYSRKALEYSQSITTKLDRSEGRIIDSQARIDRSIERIEGSQARIDFVERELRTLQQSTRQSQSIISSIRKRGQVKN